MSKQFHNAMTDILAMPYFKNEHHGSAGAKFGHEDAVALKIKTAGFTEVNISQFPKLTKKILKEWASTGNTTLITTVTVKLPPGSFIIQPAGSQGFPDILVKDFCGRLIAVECKSGKNGTCPMWNDNVPRPESIYILSSGKENATTVFMGKDVIDTKTYNLLALQEAEIEVIVKKYNLLMPAADKFKRGWIQKSRKQHFQGGGSAKTNYFTHADRKLCETNVLNFAKQ